MYLIRHVLWLMLLCQIISAQNEIPIGSWRTHFSYRDAHNLAVSESGVYCIGTNSLFFLNFLDQNLERLGKIDGLSEAGFSTAAYHSDLNILVIAYTNGNIDLLSNNVVTNISSIVEGPSTSSKKINHISFREGLAYLSTAFGVVVVDLIKAEVMEAYRNLGDSGENIAVNYGAIYNDTLFLATEAGILAGNLDPAINLQDFRNWNRFDKNSGIPKVEISTIAANEEQLLSTINYDGIYSYSKNSWTRLNTSEPNKFISASSGSPILLTEGGKIISVSPTNELVEVSHPLFSKPQAAALLDSQLWIADSINGMVTNTTGEFISLFPNGPFSDSVASIHFQGETVFALPPGYDDIRNPLSTRLGFYQFDQNEWISYNASGSTDTHSFPAIKNLIDISYNPLNKKFYFASFGEGLVEWDPDGEFRILDETAPGGTLENIIPEGRNVWVTSVNNLEGVVWAVNYGNTHSIHRFDPENEQWTAFESSFPAGRYPLDLQVAQNGDFWLRLDPSQGGGIWVFDPENGAQRHLTSKTNEGGLPNRKVNDLQIDQGGMVWLATDQGVFHYPFSFDILNNNPVNASPILIDGRPLLADETVNCIAVDGGNRKWIGTNSGIWLVSEQGDEVIYNFNIGNSPLPSNQILDVTVNQVNGEIFIVTELGVVSYRGTATSGSEIQQDGVKIFPNPVSRAYQGLVGISGVVNNAIVKISDLTGKLINEVRASGGTAVWDISDYQGRRVQSGVYLVFSSNTDGNETYIGKIAVIN